MCINAKKHSLNPYTVHNTPKPICTLALNSSQRVRYFYPAPVISLDLSRCGLQAKAIACSWPVGCRRRGHTSMGAEEGMKEGRQCNIELRASVFVRARVSVLSCLLVRSRGRWRKNGVGGRGGAVHASIPLRDKSACPAKKKTGRANS